MTKPEIPYFFEFIIVALTAGCVFHPAAAGFAMLVMYGYRIAERYFTRNLSDQDREDIKQVKADCAAIKVIQDRAGLSQAFKKL